MRKFFKSAFLLTLLFMAGNALAADITLTIRSGDNIIFPAATVVLPTGITSIEDSDGTAHDIDENSVLAVLKSADDASESFEMSELTYFSSFGSLYLKCITAESVLCDNWQYVVDGTSPFSGIDQEILSGGENVYLYFGPTSQISLSSESITTAETVTVTATKYDYENNAWVIRDSITVGLTQPNPDDPFSPLEISTLPVDANGSAIFSNIAKGTYDVGVKEDFYFPTKTLLVSEPAPSGGGISSSGGNRRSKSEGEVLGAETVILKKFDTKKAFEFLLAQQEEDGFFVNDMYTDWIALALATGNYQKETTKLVKYLSTSKLDAPRLTDYERRAMALMALGLNPYNANGVNYIDNILSSFDGTQFGDTNEDNDDIFALLALMNAGYGPEEEVLAKSTAFILGRQRENGSWDESVDMTGAAIAALAPLKENESVQNALAKAKEFLKEAQGDRSDGSWTKSASSTAWALESIKALGEKQEDWARSGSAPYDFFGTLQDADGGIKGENLNNRIWETAYVISAMSDKTWAETMQKFAKVETPMLVAEKPKPELRAPETPKPLGRSPATGEAQPKLEPTEIKATVATAAAKPEQNWFKRLLENIFGF